MNKKLLLTTIIAVSITFSAFSIEAFATPTKMSDGSYFDAEYYAQNNPDVVTALGSQDADVLYLHYINFGMTEGRYPYDPSLTSQIQKIESTSQSQPTIRKAKTTGEKNALKKAKSYLKHSSFSHDGLVNQLEYEKFSYAESLFAADNCGANWNEQALKKAKSYLKSSSFSLEGLIEQLEYEKFTPDQAAFGVMNCGADWNVQAAKKAASYMKSLSLSKERLLEQLKYEKFTDTQAAFGVASVGY